MSADTPEKLVLCPLCEGENLASGYSIPGNGYVQCECGACVIKGDDFGSPMDEAEAVAAWNHRPAEQALRDENKALREALQNIAAMHDGNPSDAMADLPIGEYRAVILAEMQKCAREALAQSGDA